MKKDLKSYVEHDKDYKELLGVESFRKVKYEYDTKNVFETDGFIKAINKSGNKKLHIDIGSGGGWLLFKTSPLFEKVIGIEPSKAACDNTSILIKENNFRNIELINSDMVDAVKKINLKSPAFFTTAIVLSHIKDSYVKVFLKLINTEVVSTGSTLFFCERYDKNIQQNLWHIRRKYWWANNLSEWQLEFFDIENTGYKSGIYGTKVGKEKVTETYKPSLKENFLWLMDGIKQKMLGIGRYIKRFLKK
jgi:hypothetical protein